MFITFSPDGTDILKEIRARAGIAPKKGFAKLVIKTI